MDRVEESIARKSIALGELFDERGRRLWAAVEAGELGRWWLKMGSTRYPQARDLLITADGGGSKGYRLGHWSFSASTRPISPAATA
jgi:hypothetical protein